jgi:hypothetical protein
VLRNYIYFLSYDGVYMLKTVGYTEDKANVEKVDGRIANLIPKKSNACAIVHNGQYQLMFPDENLRARYYFDLNAWTLDKSPKLNFHRMMIWDNEVFGQEGSSGIVQKFDPTKFDDDGYVYEEEWESKSHDFGVPYHTKKLKEVQFLSAPTNGTIKANVNIYADAANVLSPDTGKAVVNPDGSVSWVATSAPNLTVKGGTTLGLWEMGGSPFGTVETSVDTLSISGKCHRVRVNVKHSENRPFTLLGLGFVYKLKKPTRG